MSEEADVVRPFQLAPPPRMPPMGPSSKSSSAKQTQPLVARRPREEEDPGMLPPAILLSLDIAFSRTPASQARTQRVRGLEKESAIRVKLPCSSGLRPVATSDACSQSVRPS